MGQSVPPPGTINKPLLSRNKFAVIIKQSVYAKILHTLNNLLHTLELSIEYQHVRRLVYAVYAKTNKNNFYNES
jgi:hypothetical protein